MANFPLVTFNSGELSPLIDSRSDIDKYRAGCRILENMIPRIYGPATRRPGTKYIDTCSGVSRIIPFIYSNEIAYIVLLQDHRMYFYYDGGRVLGDDGRRYSIETPYDAADLFELQFKQSNDVMWIVHNDYAPRKLSRLTASSFSLDEIVFNNGPFQTRNDIGIDNGVTLAPSVTTGTGTLTASGDTFVAGHVGTLFRITQPRVDTSISGELTAVGVLGGTSILTEGPCTLNISDGWAGTIELQRSIDAGVTWETRRSFYCNDGKRAIQYTFNEEEDNILHRVYVSDYSATYEQEMQAVGEEGILRYIAEFTSTISGDLTVDSSTQSGICRVTGYTSPTVVSMTVLKDFASTDADVRWYEGCWSTYRGYPKSVTFFEERVVYAGTPHQPQTIWLSGTDDYEDFKAGVNGDDSFSLTISSETRNAIQWIGALEALLVGTSGGEWRIGTSADNEALTPTNYSIKQQSNYGSRDLQALQVGDVILFADFVGRKVRELTFSGSAFKYVAPDLTALAEHITQTGITGMAFQRNPDPILWCFLANGTLISMTYEREQNVIAWAKHPFYLGDNVVDEVPAVDAVPATYTYSWFAETNEIWGVPIGDGSLLVSLDADGSAVSEGGGVVSLPLANNPYVEGDVITIEGTTKYDGDHTLVNGTNSSRIYFTDTYNAETFDGTETVIRHISGLIPSASNIALDADGSIYFGHNYYEPENSYVTKITIDGTKTHPLNFATIPAFPSAHTVTALEMSPDSSYLYVLTSAYLYKFDIETGDEEWAISHTFDGYDIALSSDGRIYFGRSIGSQQMLVYSVEDGSLIMSIPLMGDRKAGYVTGSASAYEVLIDETLGIVVAGGGQYCAKTEDYSVCYNMCACTLDGAVGDQVAVGGVSVGPSLAGTYNIGTGQITSDGSYIYVLTEPVWTLYKYAWNGSELVQVKSAPISVPHARSVYLDLYGNLVVVNQDGTDKDVFWFYDKELNYLSKIDNLPTSVLSTWDTFLFSRSNILFNGDLGSAAVAGTDAYTIEGTGVNSVACIPGAAEDEVWLIVGRYINGELVRYLEQMQPRDWGDDAEDQWFLDSALSLETADADGIVSGLDHLEGEEVAILVDGAVRPNQTVSGGSVDTQGAILRKAVIGLPFRYTLKPMRIDFTSGTHTTQTVVGNIAEIVASFYQSGNVEFGVDTDNLFPLEWRTTEPYDEPPALYTGDKLLSVEGGFDAEDTFIITGNSPLNCTLRSLIPRKHVTGR